MSEDFARNFGEKDAAESIHREDEVRVQMAEYKTLKYVAHYLASNGKTLEVYGLTELRAYSNWMAPLRSLKYVAHYLASNGKTLEVYGLTELRACSGVSAEVDGPATESIVQQELNAYSQTDLEHVTELIGQVNRNQPDVFDQVVRAVEHPVGGENYISSMARVVLENPFFWSKYLRMFDLGAKAPLR
ncbi:Helitron helicase [Phytophthora megakarya]|uniref:Helitron helicase n=1 Tax=Phytophthora megakarya TaxID=4795 RepID=A0A225UN67_9STRA|nr:Helitron helicase [Phytophthora megakarya]